MVCLCILHCVYVVFMTMFILCLETCVFLCLWSCVFMVCLCILHNDYGVLTTPCAVALVQYCSVYRFAFWGLNFDIFVFHFILETCR